MAIQSDTIMSFLDFIGLENSKQYLQIPHGNSKPNRENGPEHKGQQ
jgi:hypothetical protein